MLKNSKNKFIIGMAARMTIDKRQDLIIEMVNSYREYFLKKNIFFSLIGIGDCFQKYRKTISKYNLNKIITMPGYLDEKNIIKWFKNLDIYIHISEDETTSTSILQAMSMSLPVLCSDVDGNKMLLKNKNLLIIPNKKKDIFDHIKLLYENKKLRNNFGRNARKIVEKQYNAKNLFKNYINFIINEN